MSNWNIPPPTYDALSTTSTTTLTPYLQLPHLLSLTWLAYPVLSLIFVAFRLQLSLDDATKGIASAKDDLLASCKAAEEAATTSASMPRYLALATNRQFVEAVNGSMNAARATLVLALTIMEGIINFIVDIYRSTFLCFLELVVRGGLSILITAVQELNQVVQSVASGLRTSIQSDIASANNIIKTAIDGINKVNPFGDIKAPQINVPSLDGLSNISLPSSIQDSLTKLNSSIPSIADIKAKVEAVIDQPFELVKKDINDTFGAISFKPELLPVPEQNRLTFCGDLDLSVVDDLGRDLIKTAKIGVVLLIVLALVLVGLNCLLTWYRWRCMKNHLEYTRQAWMTDPTLVNPKASLSAPQITLNDHNLMMLQANSDHPLVARITNQLSSKLRLSTSQHTHMQWFFHYIFHAPALACFLIGFFGLLSVQIQLIAMGPIVHKYQSRAASAVTDFSLTIASSINTSMQNQSTVYAREINGRVDAIQSDINDGVFGWVNGTTSTLNSTINEFYSEIENAVATVFNGTILEAPANDFLKCFLGSKVDAIENALTFLHDNLHVDMPRVNETILLLSPDAVAEASRPIAAAAIGGGEGNDQGLIGKLVNSYAEGLKKERVVFAIFLALWGVVVLMGLGIVLWHSFGQPAVEKRKRRQYELNQKGGGAMGPTGTFGSMEATRNFEPMAETEKGRAAFRPFWQQSSARNVSADNISVASSDETMSNDRPWEKAFAQPQPQPQRTQRATKLLSLGRKAFTKEPTIRQDGDKELEIVPVPLTPAATQTRDVGQRNTAWYDKMSGLLSRKKKDEDDKDSVDFWQPTPVTASPLDDEENQLQEGPAGLKIQTQHDVPERSRFSTTPEANKPTWKSILSPTTQRYPLPTVAPSVVVSPVLGPETPYMSIGVPIQKPIDPIQLYDRDPFMRTSTVAPMPVPLHNGFESRSYSSQKPQQSSFPSPPRHPDMFTRMKKRLSDSSSSPPPATSPKIPLIQTPLAPPPPSHIYSQYSRYPAPERPLRSPHRKSFSLGGLENTPKGRIASWRVTNAIPGESAYNSSASSLVPSVQTRTEGNLNVNADEPLPITPVTRYLTTQHARSSSSVNPFITPFDDEHQVKIDPPKAGLRKSMKTDPFAMAI